MAKSKQDKQMERRRKDPGNAAGEPRPQGQRKHAVGLRQAAVQRMARGGNLTALARELGVHRNVLYYWRNHPPERQEAVAPEWDPRVHQVRELQGRIASLEGSLGRKTLELDFFESALRRVEGRRTNSSSTGGTASTQRSGNARRRKAD
jgi:transposase